MNKTLIENAIDEALYLLYDEMESVCDDDLKENYDCVIKQLEQAKSELNNL